MENALQEKAKVEYATATEEQRSLLEKLFGKETFEPNIMERVKTFEDACAVLGIPVADVEIARVPDSMKGDLVSMQNYAKLIVIARALNQGWKPDWSNPGENKYFPWFKHKPGSGLSYHDWSYTYSLTYVGSRLCFKTAELAEYAGKQFESIYRDYLTL